MRIAHISDLHFGKHFMPVVAEQLRASIESLRPDAIIVSGDVTQRAKAEEFDHCLAYLNDLQAAINQAPMLVVPGNHDVPLYHLWNRLTRPYDQFDAHFGSLPKTINTPDVLLVGMNSTSPYRALVNGRVASSELARCGQLFSASPREQWRVLVLHHHLLPPPGYDRRRPMPKSKRLLNWLHEMEVDVVLNGHLHRAYVGNTLDVYPGSHRSQGITVVQSGTSTSQRGRGYEREKNSFNLIDFQEHGLCIEHWMYIAGQGAQFHKVSKHEFSRSNE